MEIIELARAKINLTLDVLGRRPDGYHELKTVFQTVALHDTLRITRGKKEQIALFCTDQTLPAGPDNLAWRAADLFLQRYGIDQGVNIIIEKRIPVAAGLGGGSSDAAAVLRGLARLFGLQAAEEDLRALCAQLGADVAFCLAGGTALGCGRGELLEMLPPCPHFHVVLANPGFAVSTAEIYGALRVGEVMHPDTDGMLQALASRDREKIGLLLSNALEAATFRLYPAVKSVKERLAAAGPALMCGSGPTVFVLLRERKEAVELAETLQKEGLQALVTEIWPGGEKDV